jgi:hypothetical protein
VLCPSLKNNQENWSIRRRIGQCAEIDQLGGSLPTDWPIWRIGQSDLTERREKDRRGLARLWELGAMDLNIAVAYPWYESISVALRGFTPNVIIIFVNSIGQNNYICQSVVIPLHGNFGNCATPVKN